MPGPKVIPVSATLIGFITFPICTSCCAIKFSKISVGATENSIIAACLAKGKTILKNCAIEPEIKDLTNFLNSAGANIKWIGKRTVKIIGVDSLKEIKYSVMGDRIETGTFCVAACLSSGDLIIKNFNYDINL